MFDFAITMQLGGRDAGAYVGRSRDLVKPGLPPGTTSLFLAAFALNTKAQIVDTIRPQK
jgi:hypothetical protein